MTVTAVILLFAIVCFILAAFNLPRNISIGWLGLAFFAASFLIH